MQNQFFLTISIDKTRNFKEDACVNSNISSSCFQQTTFKVKIRAREFTVLNKEIIIEIKSVCFISPLCTILNLGIIKKQMYKIVLKYFSNFDDSIAFNKSSGSQINYRLMRITRFGKKIITDKSIDLVSEKFVCTDIGIEKRILA